MTTTYFSVLVYEYFLDEITRMIGTAYPQRMNYFVMTAVNNKDTV